MKESVKHKHSCCIKIQHSPYIPCFLRARLQHLSNQTPLRPSIIDGTINVISDILEPVDVLFIINDPHISAVEANRDPRA